MKNSVLYLTITVDLMCNRHDNNDKLSFLFFFNNVFYLNDYIKYCTLNHNCIAHSLGVKEGKNYH